MRQPSKSNQRKKGAGSHAEQRESSRANEKSRNPDVRDSSRQARIGRQPGVRAEKVNEEDELGEIAKGGDFPDVRRNRPKARHGRK